MPTTKWKNKKKKDEEEEEEWGGGRVRKNRTEISMKKQKSRANCMSLSEAVRNSTNWKTEPQTENK